MAREARKYYQAAYIKRYPRLTEHRNTQVGAILIGEASLRVADTTAFIKKLLDHPQSNSLFERSNQERKCMW